MQKIPKPHQTSLKFSQPHANRSHSINKNPQISSIFSQYFPTSTLFNTKIHQTSSNLKHWCMINACLKQFILEAYLRHTSSILEAYSNQTWSILKSYLNHTGSISKAHLKHTWTIHEAYLKPTWSILEAYLKHTWCILEAYLKCTQFKLGGFIIRIKSTIYNVLL